MDPGGEEQAWPEGVVEARRRSIRSRIKIHEGVVTEGRFPCKAPTLQEVLAEVDHKNLDLEVKPFSEGMVRQYLHLYLYLYLVPGEHSRKPQCVGVEQDGGKDTCSCQTVPGREEEGGVGG